MEPTIPSTLTTIEAVLFDYGQVLSGPPNPAAWQEMRSITGLDEEPLQSGYWLHRHEYDRGTHTGATYWHLAGESQGVNLDATQIEALIQADTALWTDLNLSMVTWSRQLQQAGIRTGILSNLGDAMAESLLAKFDWIGQFDHCTWSHTLKLAKPEAAIYRHAAAGLQTSPDRILFIDDRADNVKGARLSGMQAIEYSTHPVFLREMRDRGMEYLLRP